MSRGRNEQNSFEEWLSQTDWKNVNWQGGIVPIGLALLILLVIWGVMSSFYTVQPEGEAVVKRFGRVVGIKPPGLHFKLPFGIDRQTFVPTARVLKQEFGFSTSGGTMVARTNYKKSQEHQDESLMLTGDLKVVDVEWVVQYRVQDPNMYLHRVADIDKTIRDASEAVMRRIVGNSLGSDVLTIKRVQIAMSAKDELQQILDSFGMGVSIGTVELQDVTPPDPVKPAFNEVNQAEQEKERLINEAEKRRNQSLPRARGQAQQLLEEAEGYRAQRVNRARGDVARFSALLEQYLDSPSLTRQRMYLEMIDDVYPNLGRVLVVEHGQVPPIPFMNLGTAQPSRIETPGPTPIGTDSPKSRSSAGGR